MKLVALLALAIACKSNDGRGSELDRKFERARDSVKPGDPWAGATKQLEQQLGPAQATTELEWRWATLDGDHCYDARLLRNAGGDKVVGVMGGHVNSAVADRFERCKALATAR